MKHQKIEKSGCAQSRDRDNKVYAKKRMQPSAVLFLLLLGTLGQVMIESQDSRKHIAAAYGRMGAQT